MLKWIAAYFLVSAIVTCFVLLVLGGIGEEIINPYEGTEL